LSPSISKTHCARWTFRDAATAMEFCYHVRKWCVPEKVARANAKVSVRIPDDQKFKEATDLARCFQGVRQMEVRS